MEELKPLIDATAYWIAVDAHLRIFWNVLGVLALSAAPFIALFLVRCVPPPRPKRKPTPTQQGE